LVSSDMVSILVAATFYHDAVYEVDSVTGSNERHSADLWIKDVKAHGKCNNTEEISDVWKCIHATSGCPSEMSIPSFNDSIDEWAKWFAVLDWSILGSPLHEKILYEEAIRKEYDHVDYSDYMKGRLAFLSEVSNADNGWNVSALIDYVEHRKISLGIYAGTFSPFHVGHADVLRKAQKLFDKVIVAIGVNLEKTTIRTEGVVNQLPHTCVRSFAGLLTEFIQEYKNDGVYSGITVIRGLRNASDYAYEMNQFRAMQDFMPDLEIVFIPCSKELEHVSSTLVRTIDHFAPSEVDRYMVIPEGRSGNVREKGRSEEQRWANEQDQEALEGLKSIYGKRSTTNSSCP